MEQISFFPCLPVCYENYRDYNGVKIIRDYNCCGWSLQDPSDPFTFYCNRKNTSYVLKCGGLYKPSGDYKLDWGFLYAK